MGDAGQSARRHQAVFRRGVWVDSRVRMDDATLAAMDLAVVTLNERATDENQRIPDIFERDECPSAPVLRFSVSRPASIP